MTKLGWKLVVSGADNLSEEIKAKLDSLKDQVAQSGPRVVSNGVVAELCHTSSKAITLDSDRKKKEVILDFH